MHHAWDLKKLTIEKSKEEIALKSGKNRGDFRWKIICNKLFTEKKQISNNFF